MKFNTTFKINILLISFIIAISSIIFINKNHININTQFENKNKNINAKLQFGEYLVSELNELKSLFFQMGVSKKEKYLNILVKKSNNNIENLKQLLDILENGGIFIEKSNLNIANNKKLLTKIYYKSDNKTPLEAIQLRPKINDFKSKLSYIKKLLINNIKLKKNINKKNINEIKKLDKKITIFFKKEIYIFNRAIEDIRRFLYKENLEYNSLIEKNKQELENIRSTKSYLMFFILITISILSIWIINSISNDNKKLKKEKEKSKSILNSSPNMILVTNGEKIINANKTLLNFFNKENLNTFLNETSCICEKFYKNINKEDYFNGKTKNNINWVNYLLKNSKNEMKVIFLDQENKKRHFKIFLSKNKDSIIISFNEITTEVQKEKELILLNNNLENIIENKTRELIDINENLEKKIQLEVSKNREKEKQLIQQSRLVAMGEMIGNIAHQWRQPLSAINSTVSSIMIQKELHVLTEEEEKKSLENIIEYTSFLSDTIETFREFFKDDKESVDYNLTKVIKDSIRIIETTFNSFDINIINLFVNKESVPLNGFPSEISQVILNILNNSKDAYIENKILENKNIYLDIKHDDKFIELKIQDNAGGIPEEIIEKIFDPYFTTKHQSQGTGIGLYMSKNIIEKKIHGKIHGKLSVKNKYFKHKDIGGYGAEFTIKIYK